MSRGWQAKREHRHQDARCRGVVGGFRAGDAFDCAFAELLRFGRELLLDIVAQKGRDLGAPADRRHIAQRTVVCTEKGEVEVEVQDREEEQRTNETQVEVRASLKVKSKIVQLGATLGFNIWVPPSDRSKIAELLPASDPRLCVARLCPLRRGWYCKGASGTGASDYGR